MRSFSTVDGTKKKIWAQLICLVLQIDVNLKFTTEICLSSSMHSLKSLKTV